MTLHGGNVAHCKGAPVTGDVSVTSQYNGGMRRDVMSSGDHRGTGDRQYFVLEEEAGNGSLMANC